MEVCFPVYEEKKRKEKLVWSERSEVFLLRGSGISSSSYCVWVMPLYLQAGLL